jgi:transcriptional regulator with XRE-family HTH domain
MTKLKAARIERRMTQVDLAFHSRVAPTDISKFENGMARPYPTQAARLASVLGLEPSELLESPTADLAHVRSSVR